MNIVGMVPETNTPEVAAAVGMPLYRVHGALLALKNAASPVIIDLLEWQNPTDEFHGSRFFCFKDPDGTYLEIVENF